MELMAAMELAVKVSECALPQPIVPEPRSRCSRQVFPPRLAPLAARSTGLQARGVDAMSDAPMGVKWPSDTWHHDDR